MEPSSSKDYGPYGATSCNYPEGSYGQTNHNMEDMVAPLPSPQYRLVGPSSSESQGFSGGEYIREVPGGSQEKMEDDDDDGEDPRGLDWDSDEGLVDGSSPWGDYAPDSQEDSDDESNRTRIIPVQNRYVKFLYDRLKTSGKDENREGQINLSVKNENGSMSVEDQKKMNSCFYCGKLVLDITQHLLSHTSEKEMIFLLSLDEDSNERKSILESFRLKGNYRHNLECLKNGVGNLIVLRSPRYQSEASSFVPCPFCFGFLHERHLLKHACNECCYRLNTYLADDALEQGRLLLLTHLNPSTSSEFKMRVLVKMKNDDLKQRVQSDPLIVAFGNSELSRLRASREKYFCVSRRLRHLGRLLLECERLHGSIMTMTDLLDPARFDLVVRSLQNLSVGDKRPKLLGFRIGNALRKISNMAKSIAVKSNNDEQKKKIELFVSVLDSQWNTLVSSSVIQELHDEELNEDILSPVTSDIMKFSDHINQVLRVCKLKILETPSLDNYYDLARITYCHVVAFNKRREREVSNITVEGFYSRFKCSSKKSEDIFVGDLCDLERELTKQLDIIAVVDSKGVYVPILLTPNLVTAMESLIKNRYHVGISSKNRFLFVDANKKYFRSGDTLNKVSQEAKLNNPSALISPNLRKYVASVTQVISLGREELEWLRDYFGHHSIDVHEKFYNLKEDSVVLSNVCKMLIAVEQGAIVDLADRQAPYEGENAHTSVTENRCSASFPDDRVGVTIPVSDLLEVEIDENVGNMPNSLIEYSGKMDVVKREKVRPEPGAPKKKGVRKAWPSQTRVAAFKYFRLFLNDEKVPGKSACESFMKLYGVKDRQWKDVKNLIYNEIRNVRLYGNSSTVKKNHCLT